MRPRKEERRLGGKGKSLQASEREKIEEERGFYRTQGRSQGTRALVSKLLDHKSMVC